MPIDPRCREAVGRAAALTAQGPEPTIAAHRLLERRLAELGGSAPPLASVEDRELPTAAGPVPVRVYRPRGAEPAPPVLVWLHGGGWVSGSVETADHRGRMLAAHGRCVVVSVGYRLAPEHPFPAGLADADAVTCWLAGNADALGADPTRLAIGGESAGGNLAAAVALLARDRGTPRLALQLLLVPALIRAPALPSRHADQTEWGTSAELSERCWDHYLRDPFDAWNPLVSPLLAHDLAGVAPAFLVTAEHDPLRDEGFAYAERLRAAGVEAGHLHRATMVHSFLDYSGLVDDAQRTLERCGDELRRAFGALAHRAGSPPSESGSSGRRGARGIAAASGAGEA
jgi:acetyl esterase